MGLFDFFLNRREIKKNGDEPEVEIEFAKDGTFNALMYAGTDNLFDIKGPLDFRGINKSAVQAGVSGLALVPILPFSYEYVESLYYNSDILRTVITVLLNETFGNGLSVKPKFTKKCLVCGATYDEDVDVCEACGSHRLVGPNENERKILEKFIEKANINNQPLIDVLRDLDHNLNVFDNAYLIVRKKYEYNDNGDLIAEKPLEIYSGDPKRIYLVMSSDGRPGLTRDGKNMVFVCPEHRDEPVLVPVEKLLEDPDYIPRCPKCGRKMHKAVAVYDVGGSKYFFIDGEILHLKKFTPGIGYGYPPIITLLKKLLILIKQDSFILMAYHMQRPPRGLLVLRADRNAVAKAFMTARSEAYKNPWNIVPLVISGPEKVVGKRVVEWLDLSYKPDEVTFTAYRNEVRRVVASMWQISPIFQGEVNTGISNEGLQVTITNRAIMREQALINNVLKWLVKQLKVNDWVIELNPNEPMDISRKLDRIRRRIDIVKELEELGYEVELIPTGVDGIDFKFDGKIEPSKRLKRAIELYAKRKGYRINVDDFIEVIDVLPKVGLTFESFKRLMLLAELVGGVENIIRNVEQVLNIPPLEQILYRIKYPDAASNYEQGGVQMLQDNQQEVLSQEQGIEENNEGGSLTFEDWLNELLNESDEVEGQPAESGVKMFNSEEGEKFEGQPEMNRKEMPGMEHLYERRE